MNLVAGYTAIALFVLALAIGLPMMAAELNSTTWPTGVSEFMRVLPILSGLSIFLLIWAIAKRVFPD